MAQDTKPPPDHKELHADPLYLSALASLGLNVPQKLMAGPAKGSIAVLPFTNMSGDPEQEFFTDGLTEDIITDLSNVSGLFVIARHSTFAYKGKPTDVRQIARDLGVKYILEGSARRSAQRLRVNVQLIDAAEGGNHIWAERFDRDLADIFAVQDEVTRRIVEAITGKLGQGPIVERYRPSNLEAYDLCTRWRNNYPRSKAAASEAKIALERAILLDPLYAEAYGELARVRAILWVYYGEDRNVHQKAALALAEKAIQLDPNDGTTHGIFGWVLMHDGRWEEAERQIELSVEMNPNDAECLMLFADYKSRIGEPRDGLELMARAFRLNPRAPSSYYWTLADLHIDLGQYEEAVKTLDRVEIRHSMARRQLAAALALSGHQKEAEREAAAFMVDYPDWSIDKWSKSTPTKSLADLKTIISGYRLAGLPE